MSRLPIQLLLLALVAGALLASTLAGDRVAAGGGPARADAGAADARLDPRAVRARDLHVAALRELGVRAGVGAARGSLDVELPARFRSGMHLDSGVARIHVAPIGAADAPRHASDAETATYLDAWPGIDVVQEETAGALKESLIVHRPQRRTLRFAIRGNARPALLRDGSLGFSVAGKPIALRSPAPVAIDASGARLASGVARYRLRGTLLELELALPRDATYPIVVDPTFDMGQLAAHTIGTRSFNDAEGYMGREKRSFRQPTALATDGTRLVVGDYKAKLNVWNPAPVVDGADRDMSFGGSVIQTFGVWTDGTKALAADQVGDRIMVFNSLAGNGDLVLGQPDFTSTEANVGGRSERTLASPYKVWSDGTRIAVADRANSRVLIYDSWPTSNQEAADLVLGQVDFTSGACNRGGSASASTLCNPRGVWYDGSRFYVADTDNHRVLVWNSFPTANGQAADYVLGQSNFSNRGCNAAVGAKAQLCTPHNVHASATQLFVADTSNHRVLVWNSIPTTSTVAADVEVGERGVAGTTQTRLWGPTDMAVIGSRLAVLDTGSNRVLLWSAVPVTDAAPAANVVGHADFIHGGQIDNHGDTFIDPQAVDVDLAGRVWVTSAHDTLTMRFPATLPPNGAVADYALGNATPGEPSSGAVNAFPQWSNADVVHADDGLFLSTNSNRVTWNLAAPTTNPGPVYDGVAGQPNLSATAPNRGGAAGADTLNAPKAADWDGTHLAIADTGNNRVLLWNGLPATYGAPADVVLGQADFLSTDPNPGGVSASTLSRPLDVRLYQGRLFVADSDNHRVLVWNSIPTTNGQPADIVLGQASMLTATRGLSATALDSPRSLDVDDGTLVVADTSNHRVAIWDALPTTNGEPMDRALGQANLTSETCAFDQAGLCNPSSLGLHDGRLAVLMSRPRIVVYDDIQGPSITDIGTVVAGGRATISWTTDEDASSEIIWDTASHPTEVGYPNAASAAGMRRAHALDAQPLVNGTTYYFRVRSIDSRGNVTVSGEQSFVTSNTTIMRASPSFATDGSLSEAMPTANFGGSQELRVGGTAGDLWHALLRFDLDQLPSDAVVTSATLRLTTTDAGAGGTPVVDALRVTSTSVEGLGDGTVEPDANSWQLVDGVDPWITAGGDVAAGPPAASAAAPAAVGGVLSLDVTGLVGDWVAGTHPNEGVLLRAAVEPSTEVKRFASSEHVDHTLRPVLEVQWQGTDTTNPRIGNLRVAMLSSSSARITWDTDEAATSRVEFGPTIAYGTDRRDEDAVARHSIQLDDLTPNTEYHFRVASTDAQGNTGISTDRVFRTSYRTELIAEDVFLREDLPTRNFGGQPSLYVGNAASSWLTTRTAMRFDLAALPLGASVRQSTLRVALAGQANTTQPPISLHRLTAPFTEGSGNPLVGPGIVATSGSANAAPQPLLLGAERHVALTPGGWWQITPRPDTWYSTFMFGRRNYDGSAFSSDARVTPGVTGYGREGTSIAMAGNVLWLAGLGDGGSNLQVRAFDATTGGETSLGTVAMGASATSAPGIAIASDGHLWVKAEDPVGGAVRVARSGAPGSAATWAAPETVTTQASPAHAQLVPLAGGRMLLVSQDGATLSSHVWNGATWDAPTTIATDAATPATLREDISFGAVEDGTGGAWLAYLTTSGAVHVVRYAAGAWSGADVLAASAGSVAITLDSGNDEPHVFWKDAAVLQQSRRSAGAWTPPVALPVSVPASHAQLSASPPSDEALAITWVEGPVTGRSVRWYGFALDKVADGATWATSDGASGWGSPGGDHDAAALGTQPAPNVLGATLAYDVTTQTVRWLDGLDPNDGVLLKKQVESTATTDWKSFYGSESTNAGVRPRLVVDYDLASVTFSEPNASTAWKTMSTRELVWQTTGSGMTLVDISYSTDAGATWTVVATDVPNTDEFAWTTPPAPGPMRLRIDAKNSLGVVVTTGTSADFVLDDTPPDAVDDLAIPSPTRAPALAWSQPTDVGGAGMASGTYRIYRSSTNGVLGSRIATVSALTYTDNAALAEGIWYYTVVPVDAAGNPQWTGNLQVAAVTDTSTPNPVTDLSAPALTRLPIALSWSAVTDNGAAGMGTYRVYRSGSAGPLGVLVATVAGTSTSDTPPLDGTWHYTIVPVDIADNARLTGNNQVTSTWDTTAPAGTSITLDGGAAYTRDLDVAATMTTGDATEYQLSEDPTFATSAWIAAAANATATLAASDGVHTVYARWRDAAGNVTATASDTIIVDTVRPPTPAAVADGAGADRDFDPATSTFATNWSAVTDATSGLQRQEWCLSSTTDANGCTGTVAVAWTNVGVATSASAASLTLPAGSTWHACVRSFDNAGWASAGARCSDGLTVMSVSTIAPTAGAQGRTGLVVRVDGTGFASDASVAFAGGGVTATSTTWVSSTRVDVTVSVAPGATLGARDVVVTNGEGSSASLVAGFAVEASATSFSAAGCGAVALDLPTIGPNDGGAVTGSACSITFGSTNNTAMLRIAQADGSGVAMPGIADYAAGSADWDAGDSAMGACLQGGTALGAGGWARTGSCTRTDADPWNAIAAGGSKVAETSAAGVDNATGDIYFGWRVGEAVTAGDYTANVTIEVIAPNL